MTRKKKVVPVLEEGVDESLETGKDLELNKFVEKELVPMIDSFVESHLDGKHVTKEQIQDFYDKVMEKLLNKNYIDAGRIPSFTDPEQNPTKTQGESLSKFEEAVNNTYESFNNRPTKLNMTEKLIVGVSKLCKSLGLESMSKFCMKQLTTDNLKNISNREQLLADAISIGSALKSTSNRNEPTIDKKINEIVTKRANDRTGGMGGRT